MVPAALSKRNILTFHRAKRNMRACARCQSLVKAELLNCIKEEQDRSIVKKVRCVDFRNAGTTFLLLSRKQDEALRKRTSQPVMC